MMVHRAQQVATWESSRLCVLANLWRATQRQESIVREAAQRRTQHGGQRDFVGGVIEKPQQLDQIGDLFALIEAFALYSQIRNTGTTQRAFVDPNAGERTEKDCDVAIPGYAGILPASFRNRRRDACVPSKRIDSFNQLRGVTFASVKTIALFVLRAF